MIGLGVALVAKASSVSNTNRAGYMYYWRGSYFVPNIGYETNLGEAFGASDEITVGGILLGVDAEGAFELRFCSLKVRLDLNANTVAFRKNSTDVGLPQTIAQSESGYHFAFDASTEGAAVTIVELW